MKSIKLFYDQNQAQRKANSYGDGPGSAKKENEFSHAAMKNNPGKGNSHLPREEGDLTSTREAIGMIIHEIRNPLTAISLANQSLLEEIHDDNLPPSLNTYADIVARNINRIETLLKELLHINCGNKVECMPMNICDVIDECLEKAADRVFLKKMGVLKSYSPGLLISGNAEKLSIVFLNIIINAIEAVKKGEGNLWITAYQLRNEVKVVFKDNGSGMAPEVVEHMFDKNFSGKGKGLGVGMAHVKQILAAHNASITVNSEPDTGTTIILAFKRLQ